MSKVSMLVFFIWFKGNYWISFLILKFWKLWIICLILHSSFFAHSKGCLFIEFRISINDVLTSTALFWSNFIFIINHSKWSLYFLIICLL
jgi:hypothetical protein